MKTKTTPRVKSTIPPSLIDKSQTKIRERRTASLKKDKVIIHKGAAHSGVDFLASPEDKIKTTGPRLKKQPLPAITPEHASKIYNQNLLKAIKTIEAKKFWQVGRPYFFASKTISDFNLEVLSVEKIWPSFETLEEPLSALQKEYRLFFIDSTHKDTIHALPDLETAEKKLGIPLLTISRFWDLSDDDEHTKDSNNIWRHSGRIALAALLKTGRAGFDQDISYANQLLTSIPKIIYQNSLDKSLFSAVANDTNAVFTEMVLHLGANPNTHLGLYDYRTALAIAVERDKRDVVELLLAHGAKPDFAPSAAIVSGRDAAQEANNHKLLVLFAQYDVS